MNKAEQVAEALRAEIVGDTLRPAAPLPSEARIGQRFEVSRGTVRDAIAQLRQEGLVVSYQGKGSFVRAVDERPRHTHTRFLAVDADGDWVDVATRGWDPVEAPTTYRGNATAELALTLGIEEHAPLYVHDRVLADQEGRRQSHRLHLPIATVVDHPALEAEPFVTPEQLYKALRDAGLELTCTDYIRARVPSPADIATLDLHDGGLILIIRRLVRSIDGRALALEETRLSSEDTQVMMRVSTSTHERPLRTT